MCRVKTVISRYIYTVTLGNRPSIKPLQDGNFLAKQDFSELLDECGFPVLRILIYTRLGYTIMVILKQILLSMKNSKRLICCQRTIVLLKLMYRNDACHMDWTWGICMSQGRCLAPL